MYNLKRTSLVPVAACICAAFAPNAQAQLIDNVEVRQEVNNAIVQISFVTPVQYSRSNAARSLDLVQIYYRVIPTPERINIVPSERRIVGGGDIPSISVRDESDSATMLNSVSRKLIIRFDKPTAFQIRAGRSSRSIEVVLEGLGDSVKSIVQKAPEVKGRFFVTLQSSSDPGKSLPASVPATFQDYQVFTATYVKSGKTTYDTNLGYFSSRKEAAAALKVLTARFPNASIVEVTKTAALAQAASTPAAVTGGTSQVQASGDVEASAVNLLAKAQSAFDGGQYDSAIDTLNQLLNMPPNSSSRRAQELIGLARLNAGDKVRAAAEFDLFLKLHPNGPDADRIKEILASLPKESSIEVANSQPAEQERSFISGSLSSSYYGGKATYDQFYEDYIAAGGVRQNVPGDPLTSSDQKIWINSADFNWRYRDADKDMRFVFRDSYTKDLIRDSKSKSRLTALYLDYRDLVQDVSFRIGRQSPNGGGVLYRFDGAQASYAFRPKWKVSVVAGKPTDALNQTNRTFYGMSVDAQALTKELSGSAYVIEQVIDGYTDRRGIGADLRYFKGGVSASGQLDYDQVLRKINIAALQANWQVNDSTNINALLDRRTMPVLALGNTLFYSITNSIPQRIQDLLGIQTLDGLRTVVKVNTPFVNQAHIGATTALTPKWQVGADLGITSTDAVPAIPASTTGGEPIAAQPSTGNQWTVGGQLIGSNLYSVRDTHVIGISTMGSPTYHATLLYYNNLSSLGDKWNLEPSIKYFTLTQNDSSTRDAWTLGLRTAYHVRKQISLESELTYEISKDVSAPVLDTNTGIFRTTKTSGNSVNYYLGVRYEF